jgi:hypothetical protein
MEAAMLAELSWPIWFLAAVIAADLVVLTSLVAKELRERRATAERKRQVARGARLRTPVSLSDAAPSC